MKATEPLMYCGIVSYRNSWIIEEITLSEMVSETTLNPNLRVYRTISETIKNRSKQRCDFEMSLVYDISQVTWQFVTSPRSRRGSP